MGISPSVFATSYLCPTLSRKTRTEGKARNLLDGYFPTNPIVCHKGNDKEDNIKNLNYTVFCHQGLRSVYDTP